MGVRIVWVVLLFVIRVVNYLQAEVRVAPVPIPVVASKEGEVLGFLVLDSAGKYQKMSGEIIAPNQVRISHPGIKPPNQSATHGRDFRMQTCLAKGRCLHSHFVSINSTQIRNVKVLGQRSKFSFLSVPTRIASL